ncbi:MAG TPA: hypothetical protein DGT21_19525 [Armatimonadetes bacterium]|nr:hypothetical protein [Armatimonadota bacterium]
MRATMTAATIIGVLCATPAFAADIQGGNLTITIAENGAITGCSTSADAGLVDGMAVYLNDGVGKSVVTLRPAGLRQEGDESTVTYGCALPLTVSARFRPVGHGLEVTLALANQGEQQQLLEAGIDLHIARTDGLSVYDGRSVAETPSEPFGEDDFLGRLQLCAAYNDTAGVGMGLAPTELRSWFHHLYTPGNTGGLLRTVTRLVLDAGQSDAVTFFLAAHPGEYGFYETLDAYYNTYPTWFVADPEVDPRASGGGAQYRGYHGRGPFAAENCRRLFGSWDWCYAPFRRTGDIYGRQEFWDYEPVRAMSGERAQSFEDFHRWRKDYFARSKQYGVAFMFYVPAQTWCEERLATDHYADALIEDPDERTLFTTPWVTGHDNERRVFPYKTSFGEQSLLDMRQVAEELDLVGFAFDTAEGRAKYRGPALPRLEGRAWDENGPYCRENIAVARLAQFVHTLHDSRGYKLAVVANPNPRGAYTSLLYVDSAMMEGEPWKVGRDYALMPRLMAGHKTLVWWEGYELDSFIRTERADPRQVRMLLRGLADFALYQSLRLGYIPPPNFTQGVTRLVEWLPAITDCVQTGWEPIPACRVPEPWWVTRYGNGLETRLAIAHETLDTHSGQASVQNARFAEGAVLFSHYDGRALSNRLQGGETVLDITAPNRTPLLYQAQAEILTQGTVQEAIVSHTGGVCGASTELALVGNGEARLRLRVPRDMRLISVSLDGRPVEQCDLDAATATAALSGRHTLLATFTSAVFAGQDADVLDFPFIEGNQPKCAISVRPGCTETERRCADWLSTYFRYWYTMEVSADDAPIIPVREGQPAAGPAVVITLADHEGHNVRVDGDILTVMAADAKTLDAVFGKLLRALDRRYFTPMQCFFNNSGIKGQALTWDEKP